MAMESRNDTAQALAAARQALDQAEAAREAVLLRHIANGVQIDSRTVSIDETVQIAPGAVILPGTILRGSTVIGPARSRIASCVASRTNSEPAKPSAFTEMPSNNSRVRGTSSIHSAVIRRL